ncbi:penicillin-binding protein 1A [Hyphomicrobium denitrificans 1NES1]|uniref:Penicillin-binding protein 1A n=1 Tax=Hyphomicrobium denitrificans 1NES1 TaxID=670307 RepID=N0B9L1_9HYPH|nr:penicillin-binding protein 1A [Hyphomicrobium denitrificans]AGK57221.1 penicillin-binding protein 1A [Hyphomicrobium denitrificans 1NES1]
MRAPTLPPPAAPRRRKKRRKSLLLSFLGFSFATFVLLFIAGSAGAGFLVWQASRDLPDYESLSKYEPPVMTRIHAHDGSLIAEFARERRIFVPINTIPKRVIGAFLSAEDRRFYDHGGIDLQGVMRAVFAAIEAKIHGSNKRAQGASTITQQVAKNFLLTNERSIERKIKEAILAIRIESAYSKDKILELYLNEIYLGMNSYGVGAAALTYFNKELKDLTIEECAYLAALPKGPNNYHPFRQKARATERRNWIIGEMAENGYITAEEAEAAKQKPLTVNLRPSGAHISTAEFFAEEVRRTLLARYGEDKLYGGGLSVRTTLDPHLQQLAKSALIDGLVKFDRKRGWRGPVAKIDISGDWGVALGAIRSPADIQPWRLGVVLETQKTKAIIGFKPARQQDATLVKDREAVEVSLDEMKWAAYQKGGKKIDAKSTADILKPGDVVYVAPKDPANIQGAWSLMQIPEVGGGLVAMDPYTGRVLAVAGGFSYDLSQFDRVIQAKRQPGSSFKPFVYAAAIDNGYKPTSIILDAPIEIDQGPGQDIWKPENYDEKDVTGPETLRFGIEHSRNQMTVRLAQDLGMPLIIEYAKRFGIYDDMLPVLSMSLGAGETTLLRMATGYCMLANGGKEVKATLIDRIQDRYGRTIWRHDERQCMGCTADRWANQPEPDLIDDRPQIIDPHTAYQITSILEGVVQRGTGKVLRSLDRPIAGKTGTTNEEKDAWFIGYTPTLVVGVYVGYDTPKPMGKGNTGGMIAAPIFGEFLKNALVDTPPAPFRVPPGIKFVRVDLKTGLRASADDPNTILEAFKPDEEPDDGYSMIGFANATADASVGAGDSPYPGTRSPPPPPPSARQDGGLAPNGLW